MAAFVALAVCGGIVLITVRRRPRTAAEEFYWLLAHGRKQGNNGEGSDDFDCSAAGTSAQHSTAVTCRCAMGPLSSDLAFRLAICGSLASEQ